MSPPKLLSWGGQPRHYQTPQRVSWPDDIGASVADVTGKHNSTLAYGNGRSYGDSCLALSNHVIQLSGLDRLIDADWNSGLIKAQAGITFQQLLAICIPRGWFLPVTPGTQYITLGGAIANDVHGKNHHRRGTFGKHVTAIQLIRSDKGTQLCSPNENQALFAATIGGLGLTGIIEWVAFQLIPIRTSLIDSQSKRFNGLDDFFSLCDDYDQSHEYTVAWIDCLPTKKNSVRGIFSAGNHKLSDTHPQPLRVIEPSKKTIPMAANFSLINQYSIKAFNQLYFHKHTKRLKRSDTAYYSFLYPLDSIDHWNRIYGKHGFQQFQCVVPEDSAADSLAEMLAIIARANTGSFLTVLKKCGEVKSPGLLSFPMQGYSLAIDFPHAPEINTRLFSQLDHAVRQAQGRLYPAKDAHMRGEDFRLFYPDWEKLETWRDPALNSHFWHRVTQS